MTYSIDEIRAAVIPIARKYNLRAVYLFGSYARGTATDSSDIDLIIDTTDTHIKSLLDLSKVYCDFENVFYKKIDLITADSLESPTHMPSQVRFRENVIKERVSIYAIA